MLYERIKMLCKEKGIAITALERELGMSRGSLCKMDIHKPSADRLQNIANFFGVSVSFLMTGEEEKKPLPEYDPDFINIIEMYSKLDDEQKEIIKNMMKVMAK